MSVTREEISSQPQMWRQGDALAFACACGTLSMRAAGGTAAQATPAEARAVSRQA